MAQTPLRQSEPDEPFQPSFADPEPFQPLPLAIALDLALPPEEALEQTHETIPTSEPANQTITASTHPPDDSHQAGDVIAERYRILHVLGQGGVGTTYQAEDLQTGEMVALKALSLRAMNDWKQMELFEREAQTLKQLDHPGIPKYLNYFHVDTPHDRAFYIVQQLAEGESLAELVKQGWRSTEAEVKAIATQILEILVYLHRLEPPIVHRDIKPQNIIRRADGRVFLLDFGAVQNTYYNTMMRGSTVVGTFGYMAPEQFRGQAVPATDFYGLAATLLFLLTWRSPADIPQDRLRINFRSRVLISEAFADWLEQMLDPDFEDRFSSARDALEALRGNRLISKFHVSVPWKALVGVGLAGVALVSGLNYYRSFALQVMGLVAPPSVCDEIQAGNIGALRRYLRQGGDLVRDHSYPRYSSFLCVLNSTNPAVAQEMISRISGVNGVDEYGLSPLHWAVASPALTQQLLEQGANANVRSLDPTIRSLDSDFSLLAPQGATPLHHAIVKLINPTSPDARANVEQSIQLLLDHGADVNAIANSGQTPLAIASTYLNNSNDNERLIRLLLDRGAKVNVADQDGQTPLSLAVARNNVAIAKLLLNAGATVTVPGSQGEMALWQSAIVYGNVEMLELLLEHGANINAKDNSGITPLHAAIQTGNLSITKWLLEHGASINAKNNSGTTPLHYVIQQLAMPYDNLGMLKLLLEHGANLNVKDNNGTTPLHTAVQSGNLSITKWMLEHGANINAKDNNGTTPLCCPTKCYAIQH
jgi:serine/threonine protein kinase